MYWIPPPDQGSAPVCLGTALSPEEAAGAQARMQQSAQPGAFNQSYQPPIHNSPAANFGTNTQYQGAPFGGGSYSQGNPQYTSFTNPGNSSTPVNVSATNAPPGNVSTSGPGRGPIPANSTITNSKWDSAGGPRIATDRPNSANAPPVATASPNTNNPSGQWFNPSPAASNNISGSTRSYDPYASEFVPGRNESSSRNGMTTNRQGWTK